MIYSKIKIIPDVSFTFLANTSLLGYDQFSYKLPLVTGIECVDLFNPFLSIESKFP